MAERRAQPQTGARRSKNKKGNFAGQAGGVSGEDGRAAGIVGNESRDAAELRGRGQLHNGSSRRSMDGKSGMYAAQHLTVNQIERTGF